MNKLSSAINSIADSLKTKQETTKPSEEQAKLGQGLAKQPTKTETKKEESMKSFKDLVERVIEETNKQLSKEGQLKIKDKVFKPKTNPLSVVEVLSGDTVVFKESREGDTDADMDKTYGQLLKQMAVRGTIFTKAKFDSGEWNKI